jgi:transcriptional regulator with XRE-family HTH domain
MDAMQALKIGSEVRIARKCRGWTNAQLAESAGVAPNTVSAVENGKNVREGNLRAVLPALDIEPNAAGPSYSDEVELLRDMVGHWLLALPDSERKDAQGDLMRFILARRC